MMGCSCVKRPDETEAFTGEYSRSMAVPPGHVTAILNSEVQDESASRAFEESRVWRPSVQAFVSAGPDSKDHGSEQSTPSLPSTRLGPPPTPPPQDRIENEREGEASKYSSHFRPEVAAVVPPPPVPLHPVVSQQVSSRKETHQKTKSSNQCERMYHPPQLDHRQEIRPYTMFVPSPLSRTAEIENDGFGRAMLNPTSVRTSHFSPQAPINSIESECAEGCLKRLGPFPPINVPFKPAGKLQGRSEENRGVSEVIFEAAHPETDMVQSDGEEAISVIGCSETCTSDLTTCQSCTSANDA